MMDENVISEVQVNKKENGAGYLGQLGWFFSGAVLPMSSLSYYRKAAQKSVGSAILFFVVFTVAISTLTSIALAISTFSFNASIQKAYAAGTIPEISISQGIASVNGDQPAILLNSRDSSGQYILVAVDTTGKITEIDTDRFSQGFLLTRTELHMLTPQNGYQTMTLSELNLMFEQEPIIINAQTVSQAWMVMALAFVVLAFIFLVLWNTVVRLMILAVIALMFWGIVTLIKPNTDFGPIIITGLYAIVPAIYLSHLFNRSNFSFPGIQTFFLLLFWIVGLSAKFVNIKFFTNESAPRLWIALLGLPMLLVYIVDVFWKFPSPNGSIILWVVTLITWFAMIGLRLYFRFRVGRPEQPIA
jgi:hypothetical protein